MAAPVNPLSSLAPISSIRTPAMAGETAAAGEAFRGLLADAIGRVEQHRLNSQLTVERFLSGESEELHRVALSVQQAELAFELFVQVKNKVVQAYQEVMRMQV